MAKKRKRYTPAQRARILAAAHEQQLTGKQVAAKYGIHEVTYYAWRRGAGEEPAPGGASQTRDGLANMVRTEVRRRLQETLPKIVRDEVGAYLDTVLAAPSRAKGGVK